MIPMISLNLQHLQKIRNGSRWENDSVLPFDKHFSMGCCLHELGAVFEHAPQKSKYSTSTK
jgi:hypothetical protein